MSPALERAAPRAPFLAAAVRAERRAYPIV